MNYHVDLYNVLYQLNFYIYSIKVYFCVYLLHS